MSTASGQAETDRQSIANIFATFYEDLYRQRDIDRLPPQADHQATHNYNNTPNPLTDQIPPFTSNELRQATNQLRSGRCKDAAGVIAEMIKAGGAPLEAQLLQLFNDVSRPDAIPPTRWKQTVLTVLHKSGDTKQPQNYRPIAIIPLLYKLFARLLYNRLEPLLDQHQSPDQAGLRHNYCTTDHLYTTTLLQEQSHE